MTVEELEGFLDLISPQITMFQVEAADKICQAFESLQAERDDYKLRWEIEKANRRQVQP